MPPLHPCLPAWPRWGAGGLSPVRGCPGLTQTSGSPPPEGPTGPKHQVLTLLGGGCVGSWGSPRWGGGGQRIAQHPQWHPWAGPDPLVPAPTSSFSPPAPLPDPELPPLAPAQPKSTQAAAGNFSNSSLPARQRGVLQGSRMSTPAPRAHPCKHGVPP